MQRITIVFYMFLCFSLLIGGCDLLGRSNEDATSIDEERLLPGTLTAKVDGRDWEATGGAEAFRLTGSLEGAVSIGGARGNEESGIFLMIFNPQPEEDEAFQVSPGTYAISEEEGGVARYVRVLTDDTETYYEATGGEIVIEAIGDGAVRGSFQFNGVADDGSEVIITEGAFDVTFTTL